MLTQALLKVGGSLYDLPEFADRLRALIRRLHDRDRVDQILIFPGGGATADVVRGWHRVHGLDEETSHGLAIEALQLNARFLHRLLPEATWVERREDIANLPLIVLNPVPCLSTEEQRHPDDAPPHVWDVTSDSLAAWIAWKWRIARLVMVKSAAGILEHPVTRASQLGVVDPYFPGIAGYLPRVDWCNLREEPLSVRQWLFAGEPSVSTSDSSENRQ